MIALTPLLIALGTSAAAGATAAFQSPEQPVQAGVSVFVATLVGALLPQPVKKK